MTDPATAAFWDAQAPTFDSESDHALSEPTVRAAWRALLADALPAPPARIADLGCGTGSLSVLLAEMGHDVRGYDFAPAMIEQAAAKAQRHGVAVAFAVADVSAPPLEPATVDVVVARHVVWALPDPALAIARWCTALAPGGTVLLIEGLWSTGAGLRGEALLALVTPHVATAAVRPLNDADLWGGPIADERYLITARQA